MFELSFGKMMIIAVVALIVLGPEKLPRVARTLGHLLGRARSYANQVKQDIDREMQMDELRKLQETAKEAARSFETAVNDAGRSVESEAAKIQGGVNQTMSEAEAAVTSTTNSIAQPATDSLPVPEAAPAPLTAQDEINALQKSIAEQAQYSEAASAAPAVKPVITSEQMAETLKPTDTGKKAA